MLISYHTIGRNIRTARQQAGLTQEAFAEKLKISHLHFGRLERGERPISLEMLANMAGALGVSLDALLAGCFVGGAVTLEPDGDSKALGDAVAQLATGCTPRSRELMLTICRAVAESEKLAGETERE